MKMILQQWMTSDKKGSVKLIYLIAFIAGGLLPLAFAPVNFYPLVFIIPAILFFLFYSAATHDFSISQITKIGFLFGLGFFAIGISWVYVAIHDFGLSSVPLASLFTFLFVAFLASYIAIQAYLGQLLVRRTGVHQPFIILVIIYPACWVLMEWVRGWFLTGLPWLNLGYSQIDTPLAGFAPVLGSYGLSWLVTLIAGLLVYLVTQKNKRFIVASAIIVIMAIGQLLVSIEWTAKKDQSISVALIQGNMPQLTKWDMDAVVKRVNQYSTLTRKHWDKDLIVWPENSMTAYYHQLEKTFLNEFSKEARATDSELMPLDHLLRGLGNFFSMPMSNFSRGDWMQPLLEVRGQKIAATICYEDIFGEELIRYLPQATLLVNGSNNAWYGDSLAPHQHLQIARMRAAETGRDLMRATTNGISALVNYKGEILARSTQFESDVVSGHVQPRIGATPYVRWGNYPVLFLLILSFAVVLWKTKTR